MPDTQRQKAAKLVDADVLGLGAASQKTRKTTNPVAQHNMSKFGPASPQPRLTPTAIPFAKGGKAKAGKMQKAAQVAGMLSALTQGAGGPPAGPMGAAPPAAPAGPPMGAPPGMKKGGSKMAMKKGGHAKKKVGSAADAEERGESAAEEAGENESAGMRRGGKCMKCGGRAHGGACKMATGGHMAPRNKQGRAGFAMGGPAKQRRGVMTPAGLPTKPKRGSYDDLI